ncbi:MAG: hypothetical protein Q9190_000437, partial [Brigantiaea leucoxantha]
MNPSTLSFKQASTLLFFFLFLVINVTTRGIEVRGNSCSGGCCAGDDVSDDEVTANEEAVQDGPTSDRSAGLGIEFEASALQFYSNKCSNKDKKLTDKLKGEMVGGRRGTNWKLTVDTSPNTAGSLTAEYILDGLNIKIGSGVFMLFAKTSLWTAWDPSAASNPNTVAIELDDDCQDWEIFRPEMGGNAAGILFSVQATAPMPLEAIQDVLSKAAAEQTSPLIPSIRPNRGVVLVTKDFFQSKPNGIDPENVKDDVLGFFSLLLSYVKGASVLPQDQSPKNIISIMPRSDWSTLFKQVSSAVPGDLYDLVKVLGCYRDYGDGAEIDTMYCGGTTDKPEPNIKMDGQVFGISSSEESNSCSVEDWVRSIANGDSPDKLSEADKLVDTQVGGLGSALENIVGTTRAVPLFEFRNLDGVPAPRMQDKVTAIETEIQNYYMTSANAPRFVKKRTNSKTVHIKRQGTPSSCPQSTITPPPSMPPCYLQNEDPDQGIIQRGCICGSSTLPLLTLPDATVVDQSCSYTAMPSSNVANPISIEREYWTRNCQACTLVGGVADTPTCTSVSGCTPTSSATPASTFVVNISNNSVSIGDADNKDDGADLRKQVYSKLKALCPDNAKECDTKHNAEIDNIPTVIGGGEESENLVFTIQDSNYENTAARDKMLAAAVAKSCKKVEYEEDADPTATGCGSSPVRRDIPPHAKLIEKRTPLPICDNCPLPEFKCHYSATICAGPDHINPILASSKGDPYGNHMNIEVSWKLSETSAFNEFICDVIIEGLTALAVAVAPELAGPDIAEDIEFEALCADIAESVNPSKRGLD